MQLPRRVVTSAASVKGPTHDQGSLTVHLKYKCGAEPQFPCTICDRRYKRKQSLRRHLRTTHQVDQKQLEEHGAGNYMFIVISYIYLINISVHTTNYNLLTGLQKYRVLPFKCTKCSLDHHLKYSCGLDFQCTLCGLNYKQKSTLRNHLFRVHNIRPRTLDQYGAGNDR